ncbi:HD family phosphohydrolase [Leptospira kobayashii]|uniref:HD family phosphohydrolase n=1 Tax=Leptospira kobayashii TaxID=1917830 RepID=A0ABN6KE86_9LEPT|nr:HDOD domain-containing protein [Leptospira kobayashii]BDA77652.1 HD family phosphohydrolase [Leptospira kobayashii]
MNFQEIISQLETTKESRLNYYFVTEEQNQEIYALLVHVMGYMDKLYLVEVIFTVLKELLMNANKANAKRDYFTREKLDIQNPEDYIKGMEKFQENIILRWNEQLAHLDGGNFYIGLLIKVDGNSIHFAVENNAPITQEELARINKRIEVAKNYNDLADAFSDVSDSQESAGLGIVLIQLLLKNSGIGADKFRIHTNEKLTRATLTVPDVTSPVEITTTLKTKILNEIEGLPPLPHSLTKVIQLCNNPDADLNMISAEIEKNPSLAADLLKLSNSAFFANRSQVNSILQAVKVVGLKNLRNLLYVSGVRKIMDGQYGKMQDVWEHSNRCSYYARFLAMDHPHGNKIADTIAVSALLHDIGKFVLLSVDRAFFKKIETYQRGSDSGNSTLLEEMSIGLSHPQLGGLLAEKWEFPSDLRVAIEYHHKPFMAPTDLRDLVEIIYMANMMCDFQEQKKGFYAIDKNLLAKFNLDSLEIFSEKVKKVETLYKKSNG